jgi:Major royal jelly protein
VRTSILRNQTAWATRTAPANAFTPLGSRGRRGQSSTADMSDNGVYFAAQVQLEGVSCWDTRKPYNLNNVQMIQRDPVLLGFVNDLKLDSDRQNLWVVSNNLPTFIYGRLDYSQINFRLLRADVNRAISKTICDPQVTANPEPINTCN